MPFASIDLGSNSILMLIVGNDGRVLAEEVRVVGLGRGLGDRGLLKPDRMEAAVGVLSEYRNNLSALGIEPSQVRVVGTSAMRRALNAGTFSARIKQELGFHVEIISGQEEASLTAAGGLTGLELPEGPVLVVDTGGGSTELVFVRHRPTSQVAPRIAARTSLEIGSVRLTDEYQLDRATRPQVIAQVRRAIEAAFVDVKAEPWPRSLVAVAGAPTSLLAAQLGLREFDPQAIHNQSLELCHVRSWIERLAWSSADDRRRLLPATPERAETLLAGALILEFVLLWVHRPSLVVSSRGLRHALIPIPVH